MRRRLRAAVSASSCPACGSARVRRVGAIPLSDTFAGRRVDPMPADLVRCEDCGLGYRDPQPSQATLARLYQAGSATAWSVEVGSRRDWSLAAAVVARVAPANVLDVGCFDGGFLRMLPPGIERVGIEINPEAADRSREAGVRIAASDLNELAGTAESFDCVVAFDVIEHVHDPAAFLKMLAGVVRPGGHLIFATGNFDAPTWRVMGSRYLYCWFQEHIAFVSPRWTERQAAPLGLSVVELTPFGHLESGPVGFATGLAKNLLYRVAPGIVDASRKRSPADDAEQVLAGELPAPPAWVSARDHFLAVLRKPE